MAIVKTVYFSDFCDAFTEAGRENNFSYKGKRALFDYLEDLSDDCGKDFELDVVALCCEYSEGTYFEIAHNYRIDLSDCEDEDEKIETVREHLENESCIVGEDNGVFVYAVF